MSRCRARPGLLVASAALLISSAVLPEDPSVEIRILGGDRGTQVEVEALASSGASTSRVVSLADTREHRLNLSAEETWSIRGTAHGFWIASVDLPPDAKAVALTLWPAGEIAFDLQPPRGIAPPQELGLRLSQPVSRQLAVGQPPDPEIEISCPVGEHGVTFCVAPAGRWDLRVKAAGFVPQYRWDTLIEPEEAVTLGPLQLKEGASLLGRIASEDGPVDGREAIVEVRPAADRDSGAVGVPEGLQHLAATSTGNEWGYFHVDGLPAGSYILTVRQPGFESSALPITVTGAVDIELPDPIVLLRPLRLSVHVEPATNPVHGDWQIILLGIRQGDLVEIARGSPDEFGNWLSPAIASGTYTVQVRDRSGSSWEWTDVELSRQSQEHWVQMSLVHVEGRVRVGDEPFSARLWFGGRHGSVQVAVDTDSEGEFDVLLPRAGRWAVDVLGDSRNVNVADYHVNVAEPRSSRPVRVSITLPNTRIHGYVVDRARRPVAGAQVRLLPLDRREGTLGTDSDDAGEFEILGQPAGDYSLAASAQEKSSQPVEIMLSEGMAPPSVELVLEERRRLSGRVISASGPVPGAAVLGFPMSSRGTLAALEIPQARSELDGTFRLELPQDTEQVRLVVMGLGHALAVRTVQHVDESDPVVVSLDQVQGTLEIASRPGRNEGPESAVPLVLIDGQAVDLPLLARWGQAHGATASPDRAFEVDAMPPGMYAYCELSPAEALLVLVGAAVPTRDACSEGHLTAGGRLTLTATRQR